MNERRSTEDDDLSPIRESLPEGPPAPVPPLLLEWVFLAAGGFCMRLAPSISHGTIQGAGLLLAFIAGIIAIRLLLHKSVTAKISGGFGLLIALAEVLYLLWLIRQA